MDIYSHALYVKGERIKLSYLAKEAMDIDKFSPITCCIVGNHYNLKGNHEKALKFFAAAVRFDPNYDSAWVLMGHEYIELRNIKKAISCYQQALEIQPNNFRALYGLGQAFEIQRMHVYSLFYFKKATEIRPKDPRMWCAIGEAYERIEDFENAITSFEKAYEFQDGEGIAIAKLAKLYWDLGRFEKSEIYYLELLSLDSQHPSLHEGIHTLALAYLEKRNVKKAKVYCKILFEFPGMRNEAATLMRQVQLQEQ